MANLLKLENYKVIVTCEHGGNYVPPEYQALFEPHKTILETHQGYDPGALPMAEKFAQTCADDFFYSTNCRLLIDLNRSLHHRNSFSFITGSLPSAAKETIIQNYFHPYRDTVAETMRAWIQKNFKIIHLSVHSYTPTLNYQVRNNDIGLLYDSRRKNEKKFCEQWKQQLLHADKNLIIRYNYPYLGKADGFATYLRKQLSPLNYLNVELEVNQKFYMHQKPKYEKITQALITTFQKVVIDLDAQG